MNINAEWKDCTMEDFINLSKDDIKLLSDLLIEQMCCHNSTEDKELNTLHSKLLFIIHNTH